MFNHFDVFLKTKFNYRAARFMGVVKEHQLTFLKCCHDP